MAQGEVEPVPDCEVCALNQQFNIENPGSLADTGEWLIVLDKNQELLGKTIVSLRRHVSEVSDLTIDEWQSFSRIVSQLEPALRGVFPVSHFNWLCLMNNAARSSSPRHVHWHLHPRYREDVNLFGVTFQDENFGGGRKTTPNIVNDDIIRMIKDEIQKGLSR